jgi:hypothetical protein
MDQFSVRRFGYRARVVDTVFAVLYMLWWHCVSSSTPQYVAVFYYADAWPFSVHVHFLTPFHKNKKKTQSVSAMSLWISPFSGVPLEPGTFELSRLPKNTPLGSGCQIRYPDVHATNDHAACLSALRSLASHAATRSSTSHRRSVTPAAIAGVTRSVR